jgi:hemolysin III
MAFKVRDPISAFTHLAGAAAAVVGLFILLSLNDEHSLPGTISLVVYGASLFIMFASSTTYHFVTAGPHVVQILRKVDHSAIYLLIAGTYTPFCVIAFSGFWQTGFLALIWLLAIAGIIVKVFFIHAPRWVTAGVYVIMGWMSVFATRDMLQALPANTMLWLLAGGLIYTAGAVVYITKRFDFIPGVLGFHEVWHGFVLLGAATHFMAVATLLAR